MKRTLLVAGVLVLGLTACSNGEEPGAADTTPTADQSAPTASGSVSPQPEDEGDDTEPSAGVDEDLLGEPVASREASHGGDRMRVDLYAVRRTGTLVEVNFALTLLARRDGGAQGKQIADLFSDGNHDSASESGHAVDGVRLLDPANAKVHVVASDGMGNCLCSNDLSSAFVEVDDTMVFNATFSAPPEDVESVTVSVPHFGAFTGVPVA